MINIENLEKDKQSKIHNKHERLTEIIYNSNGMLPSRYVFILTNQCNLNCDFCFINKKNLSNVMDTKDWYKVIDQLPEYSRVTLTGGEPFLFKGFSEVLERVAKKYDSNIISNGTLLTEELTDEILSYDKMGVLSISIDDIGNKNRGLGIEHPLWKKILKGIDYFVKEKTKAKSDCILDIKSTILDSNAGELFDLHKFCVEELGCDTHVFQFLKGSKIQHSDIPVSFNKLYENIPSENYKKINQIREQLEKIRNYNLKTGARTFIHPKLFSLMSKNNEVPNLDFINEPFHIPDNYLPCKYPWASVHINVNGDVYPCLAIKVGNVKEKSLNDIINGEKMKEFRNTIKEYGTIPACNRCGWLKPSEKLFSQY